MDRHGTSTIVQYVRTGDIVTAYAVHRSWHQGQFVETTRWLVPGGIQAIKRETTYGIAPGPLGYGRTDLLAGGMIKPALHTFDSLPYLSLNS